MTHPWSTRSWTRPATQDITVSTAVLKARQKPGGCRVRAYHRGLDGRAELNLEAESAGSCYIEVPGCYAGDAGSYTLIAVVR